MFQVRGVSTKSKNNMKLINIAFINKLQFSSLGFNWILQVLIGAIIGNLILFIDKNNKDLEFIVNEVE